MVDVEEEMKKFIEGFAYKPSEYEDKMEWISAKDETPPFFEDSLGVIRYLDAVWDFENGGYIQGSDFWMSPIIMIFQMVGRDSLSCGGDLLYWMPLPAPPKEI